MAQSTNNTRLRKIQYETIRKFIFHQRNKCAHIFDVITYIDFQYSSPYLKTSVLFFLQSQGPKLISTAIKYFMDLAVILSRESKTIKPQKCNWHIQVCKQH